MTQHLHILKHDVNIKHHINELKYRNHMTISIVIEKNLQNPNPCVIKVMEKLGMEGAYLH